MSKISPLTRSRDLEHLESQLQHILKEVRAEFVRQQTNAAQRGERFSAARPLEQFDVVRLVDLQSAIAQVETKVSAFGVGGGGSSGPVPPSTEAPEIVMDVGFLEAPDGMRDYFTPLHPVTGLPFKPLIYPSGHPACFLVHRNSGPIEHSLEVPPPVGMWHWHDVEGQMQWPLADVPIVGAYFRWASAVVA